MGKALILVGGFGTRLRPLTLTKPKPLVEFCNLPIVEHQIKALKEAGVNVVVLAVSYKPEDMQDAIKEMEKKYDIKLVISHETEPLGTGGLHATARPLVVITNDLHPHVSLFHLFFIYSWTIGSCPGTPR